MTAANTNPIAQLHQLQDMLIGLVENLSDADCKQQFLPEMASIGWYLGRSVYLETYFIRELLLQDDDMTTRVRHLFAAHIQPDSAIFEQLPPKEHLLNWALELQEDNLVKLANPAVLGNKPALSPDWLTRYLLQLHAQTYEKILIVLQARTIRDSSSDFMVTTELPGKLKPIQTTHVSQGHYRIGARENEIVFDNEQPAQMVELSNYRIAVNPVSNSAYLAFMQDNGYSQQEFWTEAGWAWAQQSRQHPWHWRQNTNGRWFGIGISGPSELAEDEPVAGINHDEATAFSHWLSQQDEQYKGALLQHEYQWETAARLGVIKQTGLAREWTSSQFHAYPGYEAPTIQELATSELDQPGYMTAKGVSLHSQPSIRRISLRQPVKPHEQHWLTGARLVFPPGKPFWEQ